MTKRSSMILGFLLIVFGAQIFFYRAILPVFGLETGNGRLWPLLVTNVGLLLVLPPLLERQKRGLGGMFIPGIPVLMVSSLLLLASITNWWGVWDNFWPLVVIALALGFGAAAVWMRLVWLLVPATILGVNGVIFLFCAVTGLWQMWAAIWPIEPLAVGLSLFLVNIWVRSTGLARAGMILAIVSGFGFALMSLVLSGWTSILAAVILIGSGTLLVGRNSLGLASGESERAKEKRVEAYSENDVIRMKESEKAAY